MGFLPEFLTEEKGDDWDGLQSVTKLLTCFYWVFLRSPTLGMTLVYSSLLLSLSLANLFAVIDDDLINLFIFFSFSFSLYTCLYEEVKSMFLVSISEFRRSPLNDDLGERVWLHLEREFARDV